MVPQEELLALLALHRRLFADPRHVRRLLVHFGTARQVWGNTSIDALRELRLPQTRFDALQRPATGAESARVEADLRWIEQPGHNLIRVGDPDYPSMLREIYDPPPLLFADGDVALLARDKVAIVGSRRTTLQGRKTATQIAGDLASAGLVITSGLAIGVDAAAHTGALEAGGDTVAVLGCGCDIDYPAGNKRLARRIRECGVVVSEFPLGSRATRWSFPQRNRIVTGLSLGTLVVEAALRSGSLISARLAAEQGREVFAVPGSILNAQSRGCHRLIRDGAKLTECADDVLEELPGFEACGEAPRERSIEHLPAEQKRLLALLSAEPTSIDALAVATDFPVAAVMSIVIELEIEGLVRAGGGGYALAGTISSP